MGRIDEVLGDTGFDSDENPGSLPGGARRVAGDPLGLNDIGVDGVPRQVLADGHLVLLAEVIADVASPVFILDDHLVAARSKRGHAVGPCPGAVSLGFCCDRIERNLQLSEEKTKLVHLREGFDFLGFTVKHYAVPTSPSGWRLQIQPSRKSVQRIKERLREVWRRFQGAPVAAVVRALNPIIRGWANYFRAECPGKTFAKLEKWMYDREVRYAKRRHPNKARFWMTAKYWGVPVPWRKDRWVFGDKSTGAHRLRFSWFRQKHHVPVKGTASPDDAPRRITGQSAVGATPVT